MINTPPLVVIKEDRDVFLAFKKHRDKFLVLLNAGAFDVMSGQVNIHINNGQFQQIYLNQLTYKKERPIS